MPPALIAVTGARQRQEDGRGPVAARLRLPLIAKDELKEALIRSRSTGGCSRWSEPVDVDALAEAVAENLRGV